MTIDEQISVDSKIIMEKCLVYTNFLAEQKIDRELSIKFVTQFLVKQIEYYDKKRNEIYGSAK